MCRLFCVERHIRKSKLYLRTGELLYNVIAVYIITVLIKTSAELEFHYNLLVVLILLSRPFFLSKFQISDTRVWSSMLIILLVHIYIVPNCSKTLLPTICNYYYYYTILFLYVEYWLLFTGNKWNESGFRPPLCTYRLNWARRTSWGWWDDWDDTVLQTQDSKFEPWRSEAEHATSRSRRLPAILTFTRGWGRNCFVSFKPPRPGTEPRTLAWKAAVLTTTLGPPPYLQATWK